VTDQFALSAIRRIAGNILAGYQPEPDIDVRSEMLLGSLEAGIAFSNASVALVHGMARPVGAYFHVPHGLSNAILLPVVMEWSLSGSPARYAQIARAMGVGVEGASDDDAARAGVAAVRNLASKLGVPSLSGSGVNAEKLREFAPQMAKDAIASGSPANNPRVPTEEEIVELYMKAS
jgi:alcohol dehydrogenase class IV